jgi:SAM-dependent methyltransferase
MSDTASLQRAYWNSEATRRWVTEQARIDRLFAGVTEAALAAAAPKPGEHAIDIGCGTGTTLLRLAQAVGPTGRALGVDISEQQLALARQRIAGLAQASAAHEDATVYAFDPGAFDLVFTRFGVMFFADPIAAFTNSRRALKSGGRLALAVFRPGSENPWTTASLAAIRHLVPPLTPPGPEDPGQFGWGDPARVHRILGGAGFRDVALTPLDLPITIGANAAEAAEFALFIGQGARALNGASDETRAAARTALEVFFKAHEHPDGVSLPGALWLVSARN